MLIHDRFVFLHVPKTAGTFISEALKREVLPEGSLYELPVHSGRDDIPPKARHLPVLAFVRNPWDWYVSCYHFLMRGHMNYPLADRSEDLMHRLIFDDYEASFERMVRNSCGEALRKQDPRVAEMLAAPARSVRLLARGHDFATMSFLTVTGTWPDDGQLADRSNIARQTAPLTIGRFESLIADLEQFLDATDVALRPGAAQRLRAAAPLRVTDHRPYRDYYDSRLPALVEQHCELVQRFDYTF